MRMDNPMLDPVRMLGEEPTPQDISLLDPVPT
jgi:hypothetical protein